MCRENVLLDPSVALDMPAGAEYLTIRRECSLQRWVPPAQVHQAVTEVSRSGHKLANSAIGQQPSGTTLMTYNQLRLQIELDRPGPVSEIARALLEDRQQPRPRGRMFSGGAESC